MTSRTMFAALAFALLLVFVGFPASEFNPVATVYGCDFGDHGDGGNDEDCSEDPEPEPNCYWLEAWTLIINDQGRPELVFVGRVWWCDD